MSVKTLILSAVLLSGLPASVPAVAAQDAAVDSLIARYNTYSAWCTPEKVYLHIDRTCYTAGENLWFMGWVRESSEYCALPASRFLYAELLDAKGDAVYRVKIKRTRTGFPGCIELPPTLETGDYTVRGYTLFQLNGHPEYLFNQTVHIIGAKDKKAREKKAVSAVNLTFWPESGRYFAGHKAVLGFKVADERGRSIDFSGILVSDDGQEETPVSTFHDGMGTIAFIPRPGVKYSVKCGGGQVYALPEPARDGACVQIQARGTRYYINALGYGTGHATLLVRDLSELRPLVNFPLDGSVKSLVVGQGSFRPGINHLLAVDSAGRILAERLFFVEDPKAPSCDLQVVRFVADTRALTRADVFVKDAGGTPLGGHFSVSVTRAALKDWQQADGIVSYMGLSSELRGRINDPYYYFDPSVPEAKRRLAMDALMLIQGWRYYDLDQIAKLSGGKFSLRYLREQMQEIRGRISRKHSSKMPRKFTFTFMVPRKNVYNSLKVDEANRFLIDSLDFEEGTEFLINIGKSRVGASYLPTWDGDMVAAHYAYMPAPGQARGVSVQVPLELTASDDTLTAAVVTAAQNEVELLTFGQSYTNDLETYKDMTLVEYLSIKKAFFRYDGENMFNRSPRHLSSFTDPEALEEEIGASFAEEGDNSKGLVKLLVDETEQAWWGYDMIRLEEIKSLSISTEPDPVYGGSGGIVAISLRPGGRRSSKQRSPSLLYFVPLGHQVPRYFDSPRYDKGQVTTVPDKRNTLLWNPSVQVRGGRAEIEFCNSDLSDYPLYVRIEGMTTDGRPFSHHCRISPKE